MDEQDKACAEFLESFKGKIFNSDEQLKLAIAFKAGWRAGVESTQKTPDFI